MYLRSGRLVLPDAVAQRGSAPRLKHSLQQWGEETPPFSIWHPLLLFHNALGGLAKSAMGLQTSLVSDRS